MSESESPRVFWVAGVGASAGLGAALARRFAQAGYVAVVTGRTRERLEKVAAEIRESGGQAVSIAADIGKEDQVVAAAQKVGELGRLEAAAFNAGNFSAAPSLELRAADFEEAWRINTLGGFLFGREALRGLAQHGRGSLLITGATASLRGKPPFGAFAAAKAGLRSVAQTFAREFGPRGVHVAHVVIDGVIDGERARRGAPDRAAQLGQDGLLDPDAIAEVYYQLHQQPRNAWTHELDLRPYKEAF
ncbi:MAG TPA: SDR family NAD(P)-dependent oxidoreductase [Polyangiales bacterium]|nr:SDR family NAD(P)-dependent oxidoreductase [Polyangiales bacterium]